MSLYSVVVPVYNSEHMLDELYTRVRNVFDETLRLDFELILVDDGSKDGSWKVMERLHDADPRVKIIQQAKNFGQHPALLCGFHYVNGDFVITMDDDLQHPPEEIPKLIEVMNERDDVDVIIARYEGRHHNVIRRTGTAVANYATSKMLHKPIDLDMTSFRLMRRFIVDAIIQMNVRLPQIGNLLLATSNRIINVPVRHDARAYGHSGYTFRRLTHDLFYDIIANSTFPLYLVRNIGIISFLVSLCMGLFFLIRFFVEGISVEGWTSSMLVMLAFFGLTLLSIGIIGEYLMHILEEAKKMPNYVERQKKL
jgi:dolichol-phosphate mannosyltransferase/undecaprenyl-phosphate 4-deoxy-4-formamido-L-arabinose transferase